ncbi:MAG: matrixin family metalloprotease [Bacteriovoracaceae bacterium]|nr:matrixin family metalloprotease [Bacteriovoracaceae bacterium]
MRRLIFLFLCPLLVTGCLDQQKENTAPAVLPSPPPIVYTGNAPIRWPYSTIEGARLTFVAANTFSGAEIADFETLAGQWDDSHPDYDFFNYPATEVANKDTGNLDDYYDGEMGIYKSTTWFNEISSNALGITQFFAIRRNAGTSSEFLELVHVDIIMNYRDYEFDPADPEYSNFDLSSVMLHELGHFLGVGHSSDSNAVMAPTISMGEIRDTLTDDDHGNIQNLYNTGEAQALIGSRSAIRTIESEPEIVRGIIEYRKDGEEFSYILPFIRDPR